MSFTIKLIYRNFSGKINRIPGAGNLDSGTDFCYKNASVTPFFHGGPYMSWKTFSLLKTPRQLRHFGTTGLLLTMLTGCSGQTPYMRGWAPVDRIERRWSGGNFAVGKLSADEAKVHQTLGTPQVIRLFRVNDTRQKVYEWIYLEAGQTEWFIDGKRVDYAVVDANASWLTREQRDTVQSKLTTGGILGALIGGLGAGMLLYGDKIGLRDTQ
jgi:hypothetical protein